MFRSTRQAMGLVPKLLISAVFAMLGGCGMDRLAPTLPDVIPGFTLADLKSIQDDERLTTDEKKAQIRAAVGAPDDADGDRLVQFLLTLNLP
jgi:hypothetical protein